MYIYKITNKLNNKAYIGITKRNPKVRFWEHLKYSRIKVSAITKAIKKYGKEKFIFEVIYEGIDYIQKEADFIKIFNTLAPNGYNLTTGGENPIFTENELKARKIRRKSQLPPIPKGYKQNNDWIEKRIAHRRKPVEGINIKTNEVISFTCASEAAKYLNKKGVSFIHKSCHTNCNAYGYKWKYTITSV